MERITIAMPILNGNERKYVDECIDTGWISANGRFITEFEKQFAQFCGTKYAIACCNGTVTLHLALLALGIGPGVKLLCRLLPTLQRQMQSSIAVLRLYLWTARPIHGIWTR